MQYLIGIDEAGRGPLAGPVAVGAVVVPHNFDWKLAAGVHDSKKLTAFQREEWYRKIKEMQRAGLLKFTVSFTTAATIDRRGIVHSIRDALSRCLKKLSALPHECEILLDGSLYAPQEFTMQKTIIRGDDLEPIISMASIVAKVRRDRLMIKMARLYPEYGFDAHKGYGTLAHRTEIMERGFCELHRTTFCTKLRIPENTV